MLVNFSFIILLFSTKINNMSVLRFLVLRTLEVPIIAAINGAAVGIYS